MQERIGSIISEYAGQGIHRTGTVIDNQSADWLAARITELGVTPEFDVFAMKRLDVLDARFRIADMDIEGVPLYDCTYTDAAGVTGTIGKVGSSADIGVAVASPFLAGPDIRAIEKARREHAHKAMVLVTDPRMPPDGVATVNAEAFLKPFGPPMLQIANRHWPEIEKAMTRNVTATVIAHCDYVDATARNVQATVKGADASLAPLVVMTPRSGWWRCASERGGGIAAFLEMMRAIKAAGARRDVVFTANTGHELGHLGLDHYLESHRDLIAGASMWIHLGANFAASHNPGVRLQFSDDKARTLVHRELESLHLAPANETPVGTRPLGEARNIFDGGGRYISILGSNGLFHHPDDTWPGAVDLPVTTKWVHAFADLSVELAGSGA